MKLFKKKQKSVRQPQLMAGQNDYVFRRSRTLTSTASPDVAVGAAQRGQLKTDRLKLHELKAHRRKIARLLAVVLLLIACLVFLIANFIVSPKLAATQAGVHQPDYAAYQKSIDVYFGDHPLERFGFLLDGANLATSLKHDHPELLALSLTRDWYGGNVRIGLTFRQPLLVWRTGAKQFYVDSEGIAFTYNRFTDPAVAVTDQSGLPPDQSGAVASTRFIRFLGQMVAAVDTYKKGQVTSIVIPPSTREVDLKLQGRDYPIKTNSDRDPLQQAEDIANALSWLDQRGIKPQYLDLRVAHKAFYK